MLYSHFRHFEMMTTYVASDESADGECGGGLQLGSSGRINVGNVDLKTGKYRD